jgi:hypothetical protein
MFDREKRNALVGATFALMANVGSSFSPHRGYINSLSTKVRLSDTTEPIPTPPKLPDMSQSLPFLKRPKALTGKLAGDVGFDPFGFAKDQAELMNYREAEVKHCRLAMLAAAGWPLSEVLDKKIASLFGLSAMLDNADRVPSILNGGLGKISPLYWITVIAFAGVVDFVGTGRSQKLANGKDVYLAGDFGFDPLGVYPRNEEGKKWMQLAEIKNGRLAMIAVTAFALQEAVTKVGVVDETPLFFFPIAETMKNYANSGYLQ